jgi:DNA modification methylase
MNEIKQGDCLELMKDLPNNSVDMILCDLPYGVLNKLNPSAKWDSQIDLDLLWVQYLRIIKNNGVIVLTSQGLFSSKLMVKQNKIWRYNLIWKKGEKVTGFLNANRMPMRNHEDILIFYKNKPVYNPQFSYDGKPSHKKGKKGINNETNNCYGNFNVYETRNYGNRKFPKSVINIEKEHPPIHPTQKPVALFEYLIKTYTNEGDLVLDNCVGSGTTNIACLNTNRRCIGMEMDEKYFEIATKRLEEAKEKCEH